jgi:plastocyanin
VAVRRARTAALALTVTAALGVAGIAGVATAARESATATRTLTASGSALAFSKKKLTAPRGQVKLVLNNKSTIKHNVSIKGNGLAAKKGKVVGRNGVSTVSAAVKPGKYTYFCSVPGHEAAGMKGTLTVSR